MDSEETYSDSDYSAYSDDSYESSFIDDSISLYKIVVYGHPHKVLLLACEANCTVVQRTFEHNERATVVRS